MSYVRAVSAKCLVEAGVVLRRIVR